MVPVSRALEAQIELLLINRRKKILYRTDHILFLLESFTDFDDRAAEGNSHFPGPIPILIASISSSRDLAEERQSALGGFQPLLVFPQAQLANAKSYPGNLIVFVHGQGPLQDELRIAVSLSLVVRSSQKR